MFRTEKLTVLALIVLLSGVAWSTTATVDLDQSKTVAATPGDTIYYTSSKLTLDPNFVAGLVDLPFNSSTPIDAAGSQVYVKVLDSKSVDGTYTNVDQTGNPITVDTSSLIVDIAVGAILGSAVNLDLNGTQLTLPQGLGFGLPFLFSSLTDFEFTPDPEINSTLNQGMLPIFLNTNWVRHELVVNGIIFMEGLTDSSVTNGDTEFTVNLSGLPFEINNTQTGQMEQVAEIDIDATWNKDTNLLTESSLTLSNGSSVFVDIATSLDSKENVPLQLSVGDTIEFVLDQGDLTYTTSQGTASDLLAGTLAQLSLLLGQAELIGSVITLEVTEISGLYYKTSVTGLNLTTLTVESYGDMWFVGFGRYSMGIALGTGGNDTATALTGPVTTPDFDIFAAWDVTMSFVFETLESTLSQILNLLELQALLTGNSLSLSQSLTFDHSAAGEYNYQSTIIGFLDVEGNISQTQEVNITDIGLVNVTTWQYLDLYVDVDQQLKLSYSSAGRLTTIDLALELLVEFDYQTNNTEIENLAGTVDIEELIAIIDVTYDLQETSNTDTTGSGTTSGGTSTSDSSNDTTEDNGSFVPFVMLVTSLMAIPVVRRKL